MKYVALDTETTGLYPILGVSKIFCATVCYGVGKEPKIFYDPTEIKALCEDESICKIIHNASFDGFWLKRLHNIDIKNIWDSKLMEQVLIGDNLFSEENATESQKMTLSSSLYYTLKRYGLPIHDKSFGYNFSTRPINKPLTKDEIGYAKNDVRHLHEIRALQELRLRKLNLTQVGFLENKCVEVTIKMQNYGIGIDVDRWLELEQINLNKGLYIQKRLPSRVSNWNSPAQIKKYFNDVGIPMTSLKEINDEFRAKYNDKVLNDVCIMRSYFTYVSKYGKNFLYTKKKKNKGEDRYLVDRDSRIRANFFQILNTGRYSCSKPPLHGLPKEAADGDPNNTSEQHRSAFVPRKGYVFVGGDFSGQETGIMAAASGEELWIKALLRGEDPLSLMARMLFKDWDKNKEKGCTFPKKCKCKLHKRDRQASKEITYGIAYGAYPKSISIKIKRTQKETQVLFTKHAKAAPKLNKWLERNSRATVKTRMSYSADVYRRRRTIRDPEDWMVRNVGYNNPVQSCAANMIKLAMISLDPVYPLVLTWHDDLILEVKKAQANKAAKHLKMVMERAADYCTGIKGLIKVEPRITKSLAK